MHPVMQFIDALKADRRLGAALQSPSVSYGSSNLYMRGVLEESTRSNLSRLLSELVDGSGSIVQARFALRQYVCLESAPAPMTPTATHCCAYASCCFLQLLTHGLRESLRLGRSAGPDPCTVLQVNDKKLMRPMRVRLKFKDSNGVMEE